jgi:hypothetical protein
MVVSGTQTYDACAVAHRWIHSVEPTAPANSCLVILGLGNQPGQSAFSKIDSPSSSSASVTTNAGAKRTVLSPARFTRRPP